MNKILKFLLIVSSLALIGSSCTKKLDEAYSNPNAPSAVAPERLLAPIIYNMAQNIQRDNRTIGQYIQNWLFRTSANVWDRMGYAAGSDAGGDIWRMHYWLIGQNAIQMIDSALAEKKWDYAGVGYAIQAWSWLTLTDYHGEVILKQAFNTNLLTFKYDTQDEVYAHVRELCYMALDNLNKTGDGVNQANLAKGDGYFYQGDVSKWKKFVYGVLARSYNHLTNKADYKADSVIFYCDKSLQTVADDATVKWANNGKNDEASFFGPFRGNIANYRQARFTVDLLQGNNPAFSGVDDPRKWYYLQLDSSNTAFRGLDPSLGETIYSISQRPRNFWGATATTPFPPNDSKAKYIFRDAGEFPIMTASEIQFIKAEAALRKGDKATAYEAYKKGIDLDFDMLVQRFNQNVPVANQITPAVKAAFLANTTVVPASAASLTKTKIMLQKYISLWGWGMTETWVDMRRYHYTDIDVETDVQMYAGFTPPSGNNLFPDNNGKLVYRVRPRYNSEYVWNIEELKRIGATNIDYHTVEEWFSKP